MDWIKWIKMWNNKESKRMVRSISRWLWNNKIRGN